MAPPLVVVGESGVGKSALLANWALRFRASAVTVPPPKQPSMLGRLFGRDTGRGTDESAPPVLLHFTAASADATDWAKMLRRLIGELDRRLGTTGDVPDQPLELRAEFADRLHMAAARGRVVIVLDGLNQLEDREQALDLAWLPPEIPANVRLILSTLPSRPLDELSRRGWPVLKVEPLSQEDRRDLAARYLSQYAKSLSPAQLDRVAAAPQTANPLFLRALLDELRLHGIHETLDECIAGYLTADSIAALYQQILARWEVDYERERPGMVAEAMTLVWAAREGLSETELLDLLGAAGEPLPRAYWSPLFLAAESALLNRSGLLGFGHDYVRRAVIERYLADDSDQRTAHQRLADYFDERRETTRAVTELPWQLQEAGEWDRLARVLGAPEFFVRAWNAGRFETAGYWARIEGASSGRMVDAYRPITAAPHAFDLDTAWSVGLLLWDAGHLAPALSLYRTLGESYRASNNLDSLRGALGNQAMILRMQDDLEGALILLKEQEQLCRRLNDLDGLSRSLGNQALIRRLQGNPDQAMDLLTQAEQLCRQEGDLNTLRVVLGNQALVLQSKGRLREAMKRHKEQERLCRQLGSLSGLAVALGNQAHILRAWHDPDGAMALHKQAELVCRQLGTPEGLATALANQALLLWTVRPQEALPLAEEALEIATRHEITSLIRQLRPFVEDVRSEAKPGGFP